MPILTIVIECDIPHPLTIDEMNEVTDSAAEAVETYLGDDVIMDQHFEVKQ